MAIQKPSKPSVTLPDSFGGIKTPYTEDQIENGYLDGIPQVVDGGNINYEKDATFQKLKYLEVIADAINGIPAGKMLVVDSNNRFDYQDSNLANSFGNIGDVKYTSRTDTPNGGAWCDGSYYTKAQFPDVYQMLVDGKLLSTTVSDFDAKVSTNGSCGYFALDTSNERFRVPKLADVYIKAGQSSSMFNKESLPNITGSTITDAFSDYSDTLPSPSGAFKGSYEQDGTGMAILNGEAFKTLRVVGGIFDASLSSSIYQDGAKVNPDHVIYRAYVILYATAAEVSVAQAAEFIDTVSEINTSLVTKADIDGSNISNASIFRNNIDSPCIPKQVINSEAASSQVGDIMGINSTVASPNFVVPAGGTWFCYYYNNNQSQTLIAAPVVSIVAGGTTLSMSGTGYLYGFVWRIK